MIDDSTSMSEDLFEVRSFEYAGMGSTAVSYDVMASEKRIGILFIYDVRFEYRDVRDQICQKVLDALTFRVV